MGLKSLTITDFRCIHHAQLEPAPGINLIVGSNASGKTSVLEAIFLLGRGRSFRASRREAMIREGANRLRVAGRLTDARPLGVEVARSGWNARAAGEPLTRLSELARLLPVQLMDPEVHKLVQDGPGERRRYLDWATFHVKPEFLDIWRSYQRALRQRNAALKNHQKGAAIEAWEQPLAESGRHLDRLREDTAAMLAVPVMAAANELLGLDLRLTYRPGHSAGQDLAEALAAHRTSDQRAGMTQVGPHRADLFLMLGEHQARGWVSRGQQKLVAAALVLGQARLLAPMWGNLGVLLVDDPSAELDEERCARLLKLISRLPFQVFLTTLAPHRLPDLVPARTFHVEQGELA
jgi:DNA replication and repair protein RecF